MDKTLNRFHKNSHLSKFLHKVSGVYKFNGKLPPSTICPIEGYEENSFSFRGKPNHNYIDSIKYTIWVEFLIKIDFNSKFSPHEVDFQTLINGENTTLDSKEEGDNYA